MKMIYRISPASVLSLLLLLVVQNPTGVNRVKYVPHFAIELGNLTPRLVELRKLKVQKFRWRMDGR